MIPKIIASIISMKRKYQITSAKYQKKGLDFGIYFLEFESEGFNKIA